LKATEQRERADKGGKNAMSLQYKNVDSMTFQDVEDFCLQKLPEGPRLD